MRFHTPLMARMTGRFLSSGAERKCASMAWPPARNSRKAFEPMAIASGRPSADHNE
ncbi:hypothetical protein D3C72_2175810 [compost metagenome]